MKRTAKVTRKTLETNISVEINIDGSGKSDLNSGNWFPRPYDGTNFTSWFV